MHPLIEHLLTRKPVILDGAWGTQLQYLGLEIGSCPDAWNLDHPEKVLSVASAYVEAGSQVILTNTFGGNRFILERHGLSDKVREINRAGAEISRQAANEKAYVFASIGPTGKMLLMGEASRDELAEAFGEQARALAEGGADGIVIETMSDLAEATVAVEAAKSTGLPVVASMVYDAGAAKDRTMMGVTPEEAAKALQEAGADVIGANCGQGIRGFVPITGRLRAATDLPLWIKANAGLPEMVDGIARYGTSAQEFASIAREIFSAGAAFIGGCCGTTPAFISALANEFSSDAIPG